MNIYGTGRKCEEIVPYVLRKKYRRDSEISVYDPNLKIGQIIGNSDLVERFKCGNMGGMRRSRTTNTLVLVSDYTKGLYHDKWIGGVLHYTGMGKNGDQDIGWAQNATLAECNKNGVDVHLFEVMCAGEYVYCGRVKLVDAPYIAVQPGEDGSDRRVWMFPIRPVPDNNVIKPDMFVFKDMADYQARGKTVDAAYIKILAERKRNRKKVPEKVAQPARDALPVLPKQNVAVPPKLVGKRVKHKSFGEGIVTGAVGTIIVVSFPSVGEKKLGYETCTENGLIELM